MTLLSNSTFRKAALSVLLFAFFVCSFLAGISFGVTCLQDPDTCWVLKMGEVINKEKAIPRSDPFSLNAQTPDGKPHVYYQWLSEVLLDTAYSFGKKSSNQKTESIPYEQIAAMTPEARSRIWQGTLDGDDALKMPMILGSILCAGAFLAFPLFLFFQAPKRFLSVLILILVSAQASSFHFYLRPELFSAFMFSLELLILSRIRLTILADPKHMVSIWSVVQICVLMILWCNLHCGFVLGLIVLFLFSFTQALNLTSFVSKRNVWLMFVAGSLATLVNCWGVELWIYLLKLFTSPVGARVEELQPLSIFELFSHTYFLYFLFALIVLFVFCIALFKLKSKKTFLTLLFSAVAIAMIFVMGIGARRLIPFACILGVFELTMILSILYLKSADDLKTVVEEKRNRILLPVLVSMVFGLTAFGTWWESGVFRLRLPQGSFGFPPPYEAIRFLQFQNISAQGLGLNDPQFGDMMIYYLARRSPVFIDTRFDIYSDKVVFDFLTMANCQNGWDKLLDKYKIAWIFLPHHTQLATYARAHPEQWTTLYSDDSALISRRKAFAPSK